MPAKDNILSLLAAQRGAWVSGESMGRDMKLSRAAIWKHVRKLRDEGHRIDSARKKGYRFEEAADLLSSAELSRALVATAIGRKIFSIPRTESTNKIAKELAADGAPDGTIVVAEEQTAGRGRRGRFWFSPVRLGIYCSFLLRPTLTPAQAPQLTLLAAVALAEAITDVTQLNVTIKWPNDIEADGRKIAGILTEISTGMDLIDYVVVGTGINVNIPRDAFPQEISERASSLLAETRRTYSRTSILQAYVERFDRNYRLLGVAGFAPILARWKELSSIIGKRVLIDAVSSTVEGTVKDIGADGVLLLEDAAGAMHRVFSGDISFLSGGEMINGAY
ncbi:MAG: biotin--[acetyl-CoA-carboxylase] ligase [Deltaproteobacteria bacterium]|nr:biotin--[acetyl-CoA-carboxylase] ligase [Deltaproteobacteria bacterium]